MNPSICLSVQPSMLKLDGFTSRQLCFITVSLICTVFIEPFINSAKPADMTFRWIDWTDNSINSCSVMVPINTNYAFWWRLTDLLGARTSVRGETSEEKERKCIIQIKRTRLQFLHLHKNDSQRLIDSWRDEHFPHLILPSQNPPVMNNSCLVRGTWERAAPEIAHAAKKRTEAPNLVRLRSLFTAHGRNEQGTGNYGMLLGQSRRITLLFKRSKGFSRDIYLFREGEREKENERNGALQWQTELKIKLL